ncbi:hypothetical protein D3C73_1014680 [compost metagenome]
MLPGFLFLKPESVDVGDDRLFVKVVPDQVRHVTVHELVIGYSVAHSVGDGHSPGSGGVDQSRATEHGIRAELQWIQEVVIDALVDHIHALLTGSGPHVNAVATANEVTAFNELHAHQPCKEGVLKVRTVEDARGQDNHGGIVHAGGSGFAQCGQEPPGVLLHRPDVLLAKSLGQTLGHGPPVLQDVADPRRYADVVLEHSEGSCGVANHVNARHMDANPA